MIQTEAGRSLYFSVPECTRDTMPKRMRGRKACYALEFLAFLRSFTLL
jgi:hypothetical protein